MTTSDGTRLGANACGLVAAAHGIGGDANWQSYLQQILNSTTGYGTDYGIQPSAYVASLKAALEPQFIVNEKPNWSMPGMFDSLLQEGHVVIVDIHVNGDPNYPDFY